MTTAFFKSTVAGGGESTSGGSALSAKFVQPRDLAIDAAGNVYRVAGVAEDLTEQTFLQAYRHFERAQRESDGRPLRPWLIRIAHNLAANYYRDRSRRPQTPIDDAGPLAATHTTEVLVEKRQDLERILECVQELPDDRREALIMRFALGMDNREIARARPNIAVLVDVSGRVDWKPVIGAINGWAAGAGFYLMLTSTDIRLACSTHARFKFALLSQGWVGGGPGATYLTRQVAYADAMRILLTDGRNEHESPEDLKAALDACAGRFTCDARGVGTDWEVKEVTGIASALLGTADIVADPAARSKVVATIDLAERFDAVLVSKVLRANGIVDTESYRKLGRNQLRIAMYPAIDPSDIELLTRSIDHVVGSL